MKVIICGDREWTNASLIEEHISKLIIEHPIIINGGCRGADIIAKDIAERFGLIVRTHKPKWDMYGKGAGVIRNHEMLMYKPDLVIAFHNDIENSKGTKDMVNRARKANIKVQIIKEEKHDY